PAPLGPRKATTCPLGIENDTSRTARNDPNCLHSPSASIMTDVDMPVSSSQASDQRRPSRRTHPTDHASSPVKREPAHRSVTPRCTNAWRVGLVLCITTRIGRTGSLCTSRNLNATVTSCPVKLRLKGKQDRRQNAHDKSPKKSKIRRKITTRKR